MFGSREQQLKELRGAFGMFVDCVRGLSRERFLGSLGDWTPRDIVAHFIGWNRITLVGSAQIREGVMPFYFYDGRNDYREVNAGFIRRFPSTDAERMLAEMSETWDALVSYLSTVPDAEWDQDSGVIHYRGGPATTARCVDSLIRDYRKHREEIVEGASAVPG